MKKLLYILASGLIMASCSTEELNELNGYGNVFFNMNATEDVDIKASSRATNVLNEAATATLKQNCKVEIYHAKDGQELLLNEFTNWNDTLTNGMMLIKDAELNYRIRVTAGDSVDADWTKKYYRGDTKFAVTDGTTPVSVNCNIVNTLATVKFAKEGADGWDKYITEGSVNVTIGKGSLDYGYTEPQKTGYYTFGEGDNKLTATFTGTTIHGEQFSEVFKLENINKATLYELTFTPKNNDHWESDYEGGAFFDLTINEQPIASESVQTNLYPRPAFTVVNGEGTEGETTFKVTEESNIWTVASGVTVQPKIYFRSSTTMTEAYVQSTLFTEIGLASDKISLLESNHDTLVALSQHGIVMGSSSDNRVLVLQFNTSLSEKLAAKDYAFTLHATDSHAGADSALQDQNGAKNKTTELTLTIHQDQAGV